MASAIVLPTGNVITDTPVVTALTVAKSEISALQGPVVATTASTLAVTAALHKNAIVTLDRAAGIAVTLPAATGTGNIFRFVNLTTVTSNSTTIKVADAATTMIGNALIAQDAADTAVFFECGATADTITWNGTTTGGLKGDYVEVIDVAANVFFVRVTGAATGTEATPFSATVS